MHQQKCTQKLCSGHLNECAHFAIAVYIKHCMFPASIPANIFLDTLNSCHRNLNWILSHLLAWTSPKVATGLKHQSTESPQILAEMEKTHHVSWRPYRWRMFWIACLDSLGNAGHRCCLSRRMINWLVGLTLREIFSGLVAATAADNSIWGTVIGLIGVSLAFPIMNEY